MHDNIFMETNFEKWPLVEFMLVERFGKKPNMEAILFLIGLNEVGWPADKQITKEQKQDLMHVAVCSLLSTRGYFELEGVDEDGWPHYKQTQGVDAEEMITQELLLRSCIIEYFGV
jgi:hypothetical protein